MQLIICHAVRANRRLFEAVGCVPNRVLTVYIVVEIHIFLLLQAYSRQVRGLGRSRALSFAVKRLSAAVCDHVLSQNAVKTPTRRS